MSAMYSLLFLRLITRGVSAQYMRWTVMFLRPTVCLSLSLSLSVAPVDADV